jgi:peptidoglycan/xylan/chitin deacetylase (PgdA/CDA1 family)
MDRRSALRAAAIIAASAVGAAGCDSGGARPTAAPRPAEGPTPTPPPAIPPRTRKPLPAEITHGPRDKAAVALTFHGQGDPALVRRLLGELERADARVTVFAVGGWLAAQPAMAKRILDGGHELGNHTENHAAIARMSPDRAFKEINACAQRLRSLTGSIGTWFRPSQTQHATAVIRAQAARVGYPTCVSYDVDSLDYTDPGAAAVVRTTLAGVRNGSIVSLHFGHAGTVAAMPQLLDGLRQRGLHAVTMSGLVT